MFRRWILGLALIAAAAAPAAADGEAADDPVAAAYRERVASNVPRMIHQAREALENAEQAAAAGDDARARVEIDRAIAYDPGSARAYLAKARHAGNPGAAIEAYLGVLDAVRYGYPNQLVFSLNAFLLVLWSVALGLLGTGGAIVFRYVRHVHHTIYESLQRRLGKNAALLATVLLFVPALWNTGLIPLVMFFLLWFRTIMRPRERSIVYALGIVTVVVWTVHYLSPGPLSPPNEQHGPYRVGVAAETGGTPGYHDAMEVDEPAGYVEWSRGLIAKRRGDLARAMTSYEAALAELPNEWGLHTNIGNVQYLSGDLDGALASYDRALQIEPRGAEAHLNRSQVLTDLVDFIGADESMEKAMAYGFERVDPFLAVQSEGARQAIMDVLPPESALWKLTLTGNGTGGRLPVPGGFRFLLGHNLVLTPFVLLGMIGLGIAAGQWLQRSVRTYSCTSCARIICRRCLVRVEGNAYCLDCGQTLRAECSAEYSRALLERYFQRGFSVRTALSGAVRWLLPGWAEVSEWPVIRSVFVLSLCGAALMVISIRALPIPGYPADAFSFASDPVVWGLGIGLYAIARFATWRWSSGETHEGSGDPAHRLDESDHDLEHVA